MTTLALPFLDPSFFSSSCALWWVVRPLLSVSVAPAPSLLLFVSVLSLFCLFSPPSPCPLPALRSPRVLCLVFLAVDWSRISSTTLTSPLFLCCAVLLLLPFPFVTSLLNKCPSVVLLAADWSGVSLRWFPTILPTWHCLWPQTGSGAAAFQY